MKPQAVIIDFEFTGLDNSFVTDNEIVQMKVYNVDKATVCCQNFSSKKNISAYGQLAHGIKKYTGVKKFTAHSFSKLLQRADVDVMAPLKYYGFGVEQDMLMLTKYSISIHIEDIRKMLQLSRHELRLATEGSNLESAYLIATGKHPSLANHDGVEEIWIIKELFSHAIRLRKKKFLTVMPHGHCAGMPIGQYVDNYRRQADGYRWNNNDLLASSMNVAIEQVEQKDKEEDNDDRWY